MVKAALVRQVRTETFGKAQSCVCEDDTVWIVFLDTR